MLFQPIRGLRPLPEHAQGVAELPYDVMDRDEAAAMASGRQNSFLHVSRPDIDLPDDVPTDSPAGYESAARALDRLIDSGVLRRDTREQYYAYRMSTSGHEQTGIVGGASVEAYDSGRIRRHETTRPAKQADRARHIHGVGAQTGPVLLIHPTSADIETIVSAVTAEPPETSVLGAGGVRHQVWPIHGPAQITAVGRAFEAMPHLYIADGHHRSAAASVVHHDAPTPASERFLAVAFPSAQVQILAYNRLVRLPPGLDEDGLLSRVSARVHVDEMPAPVVPEKAGQYGLYMAGRWYLLTAGDHLLDSPDPASRLDVSVLQQNVLGPGFGIGDPRTDPRIGFAGGVRRLDELMAWVDSGRWDAALTVHPTSVAQLIEVADAGGIMPPKSTWFEPKLLDGLVSHVLD